MERKILIISKAIFFYHNQSMHYCISTFTFIYLAGTFRITITKSNYKQKHQAIYHKSQ